MASVFSSCRDAQPSCQISFSNSQKPKCKSAKLLLTLSELSAVSFWGQSSQIWSSVSPNRDCGTKRVNSLACRWNQLVKPPYVTVPAFSSSFFIECQHQNLIHTSPHTTSQFVNYFLRKWALCYDCCRVTNHPYTEIAESVAVVILPCMRLKTP